MKRLSGILLHVSSLPGSYGVGDFGAHAYRFVDFLVSCKQKMWQILPLNPTTSGAGNSPYSSYSAFAGNQLFIDPEQLMDQGMLDLHDLNHAFSFPAHRADYAQAQVLRKALLKKAFNRYQGRLADDARFALFCDENVYWLEDFALFSALKARFQGAPWYEWPEELRQRQGSEIKRCKETLHMEILEEKFYQYLFFSQWQKLRTYANNRKIVIFGDLPIYVSLDSCDVWAHPHLFLLDEQKKPVFLAGAPPDYFSEHGQFWGNPLYNWEECARENYTWWLKRIRQNMVMFDLLRFDHFRGFASYWSIPAGSETAANGQWVQGPGEHFWSVLTREIPPVHFVAEDLGYITPDVHELRDKYNLPGMKVLQFAFGDDMPSNPYIPHNHIPNSVVYTGTHDNNTVRGWYEEELDQNSRIRLEKYADREINRKNVAREMIRLALSSTSLYCILPMQDVLGLDSWARMNKPSVGGSNWEWRVDWSGFDMQVKDFLHHYTVIYGRNDFRNE